MVTNLRKLVDLIPQDSIPLWLRNKIDDTKPGGLIEIFANKGMVTFFGPDGEEYTIRIQEEAPFRARILRWLRWAQDKSKGRIHNVRE